MASEKIMMGLDIGSSWVRAVVGSLSKDGQLMVDSICERPSEGVRSGVIVNVEQTLKTISSVIQEAELQAGAEVQSVITGVGGGSVGGTQSQGVVGINTKLPVGCGMAQVQHRTIVSPESICRASVGINIDIYDSVLIVAIGKVDVSGVGYFAKQACGMKSVNRVGIVGTVGVTGFYGILHRRARAYHTTLTDGRRKHRVEHLAGDALDDLFSYLHTSVLFSFARFMAKGLPTPCHVDAPHALSCRPIIPCHVDRSGDISRESSTTLGMTGWECSE